MAQAVVSVVVRNLGGFLVQQAEFLCGVRDQVEWIEGELRAIQCFLEDADHKRKGNDERVKNWVRDVRDVAYQAEDILETFVLKVERRRRRRGFKGLVTRYVLIFGELIACYSIGLDMSDVKAKILDISERRARYGITNIGENGGAGRSHVDESLQARRRILPHDDDSDVVGFKDDRKAIIKQLLDPKNTRRCVISIVGMGGQGKTTLAKKIYNEIKTSFAKYVWISVSQDYNVKEILKKIMRKVTAISKEEQDRMDEDDLKEKLHEFLKDERYLIVMDDLWSTEVWEKVVPAFPDAKNGSRIIFTSRSIEVAKSADPDTPPYELRFLDEQESWELFLRKVFPSQDVKLSCPENLVTLGQELVKRCGGLPLALVVLGGLLSKKEKNPIVWTKVKNSLTWEATKEGKQCLDILALSYEDLSCDLKSCFLYLGCFPEDSEIRATKLTRLWTAEGFIPPRNREALDETAADYLEELVQRCMVQVVERRYDGSVKIFRVHDLIRDLCILEAKEDRFLDVHSTEDQTASSASRRVALFHYSAEVLESLNSSSRYLRTLLGFNVYPSIIDSVKLRLHGLKLLRVIDLEGAPLRELPKEIKSVIHLRYLGLRKTKLSEIPATIADLCCLETLDVRNTLVRSPPDAFWKIRTLRHGYFTMASASIGNICAAKNLQTLRGIRGGPWFRTDLPQLTKLRTLEIIDVSDSDETTLSNSLRKLSCLVSSRFEGVSIPVDIIPALSGHANLHALHLSGQLSKRQQLPNSNEFPSNLTKLTLRNSALDVDPMATLEKLQNLRVLRLWDGAYTGKEMVCSAGGFLQLQQLRLNYLPALEDWSVEEGAMPRLSHLTISGCKKLKKLPQGLKLEELKLAGMPGLLKRL